MTEAEWLACDDPGAMLHCARAQSVPGHLDGLVGRLSDRKLRLFACACCRQVWHLLADDRSKKVVEVAERYADSSTFGEEVVFAHSEAVAAYDASSGSFEAELAWRCGSRIEAGLPRWFSVSTKLAAAQAALLRDIVGNPWRPVRFANDFSAVRGTPSFLRRRCATPTVLALAAAAYGDRLPDGCVQTDRLAVLSDALEEADCNVSAILDHLRDPGPHVRGCWVLDLILGKERFSHAGTTAAPIKSARPSGTTGSREDRNRGGGWTS